MKKHLVIVGLAFSVSLVTIFSGPGMTAPAQAANGSNFNAGHIISDSVFFNSSAMSAPQIQAFLNAQVPACQSGYVCLKDYAQATPSMPASSYCAAYPGGNQTAANIIAAVGASCGINPQVLLVLLQKEQSLVTHTWPSGFRFDMATGFGCPDTAACDPAVAGFFYQVYFAARQFQIYAKNPGAFNYRPGRENAILYNPNRACGTSPVFIQNQATANLYIYTPYQPNAAALSNLYGTGDSCSSYGNRNFWRIFTDWFGSTISGIDSEDATSLIYSVYNDVLGRDPDASGLSTWHSYLIGAGWPVTQVATSILFSDEYLLSQIKLAYQKVLHREFDQGGLDDWLNRIKIGTASVDEVQMTFMKSIEYYERAGTTPTSFTAVLYQDLLGRDAGKAELDYWAEQARLYGTARVVDGIWNSTESAAIRISAVYGLFLQRSVDPAGIRSWTPLIIANGTQAVRSAVLSSAEYLQNARSRYPQP